MVAPSASRETRLALARSFRTYQAEHRPELVRTRGTLVRSADGAGLGAREVLRHAPPDPREDCAHGKVAVLARRGTRAEVTCFQISDCRSRASVIACGNATAAAAAFHAELEGRRWLSMRVALPGRTNVRVGVWIGRRAERGERAVHQIWHAVPFEVAGEIRAEGRTLAVCASPLNRYLVVRTRPGERAHDVAADEAAALWRRFGSGRDPLVSRIAVVEGGAPEPRVRFFTCGERAHPSAPPTGLAVLAVVARRLGWHDLRGAERVLTPAGPIAAPRVFALAGGAATLEFPTLLVGLDPEGDPDA